MHRHLVAARHDDPRRELRRLLAETLGTFALTVVAAGGPVFSAASGGRVEPTAQGIANGLVVVAMIYALGHLSGAHINPVVTLAFAARGSFPMARVPGYWAAQIAGAVLAAALLRSLFGLVGGLGGTRPAAGHWQALGVEVLFTWLLVTVVLGTATRRGLEGTEAALPVGGTVALASLLATPISGASLNPARSLGPAIVAGNLGDVWIYVLGPVAGALLAVVLGRTLYGERTDVEGTAAMGDGDP